MKLRNVRDERIRRKCIAIILCMLLLAIMLIVDVNTKNNKEESGKYVAVEEAVRLLAYITPSLRDTFSSRRRLWCGAIQKGIHFINQYIPQPGIWGCLQ